MSRIVVGVLAHVDAGKTTLSESLLHSTGTIRKQGRVDDKNAFFDSFFLEKQRGITIFSKQAQFTTGGKEFVLLDTPGHVDFAAEMERTLNVLDYCILIISAADGVTGHTGTLFKLLKMYEIPTFIFVNKMDQHNALKEAIGISLKKNLSDNIVEMADPLFYEKAAMCDDEALDEFLETGRLTDDTVKSIIENRKLFPLFFGSALKNIGVEALVDAIGKYTEENDYSDEFAAKVYKIDRDSQGNRMTHIKVTGGSLNVKDVINDEKVSQIRVYSGEKFTAVPCVTAGDIACVLGLENTKAGDTLGVEDSSIPYIMSPVLNYAVKLPKDVPMATFLPKLRELEEEEPGLNVVMNEELGEIDVHIMGEVQIEILKSLIKDRYNVDVEFGQGRIVYKETIAAPSIGVGHFEPLRHYAEVHLLLEPGENGSGLVFESKVSEDILEKNWQRLIMTHLKERIHRGVLTGSPITDMKISIINGRAHKKHTEGGDFRQATYRAVRQGLRKAQSVLLEPFYNFLLEIPEENVGRAMTDLDKKGAKFKAPQMEDGTALISGLAPVRKLFGYSLEVAGYTKGKGQLNVSFGGYYPCHDHETIVNELGYDPDKDLRNTCDSVFCAHGAGFVVPWNEVENYMHLEDSIDKKETMESVYSLPGKSELESYYEWLDTEEVDSIIEKTFFANQSAAKKFRKKSKKREITYDYNTSKSSKPVSKKEKYLLIDGYNVIFAWNELNELASGNIDAARGRLLDIVCDYQGCVGCNVIVVFDAYRVKESQVRTFDYHNIHVVYTKHAETADAYIEKFTHENAGKYDVTVVTSDGLEQIIIRGEGAKLISSREFEEHVAKTHKETLESFSVQKESGKIYLSDMVNIELDEE